MDDLGIRNHDMKKRKRRVCFKARKQHKASVCYSKNDIASVTFSEMLVEKYNLKSISLNSHVATGIIK